MNYPRRILSHLQIRPGRRVYIKDLDVFGRVSDDWLDIICEAPMLGYKYRYTPDSVLYDDAIGERDPE